ncbi:MAG TPA: ABC transporter permease [Vicinamibacterales bacterium]|nr:ABC transporter permease [Vicinamibacterales bacterium]
MKNDILYALRTLGRSPAYAAVSILTLALGIGANTAIFSVVNGVLLKPLAYPHPEQLQFISSTFPKLNFDRFWISLPEYTEFKERTRAFQDVGGYRPGAANLGVPERPRRVNSALVTPELLKVIGVAPMRGRLFAAGDSLSGAADVAIISYRTWQSDFGGDEAVIGRVVPINGVSTQIVGIMPPGYDIHDERIEVYLPLTIDPKTFPTNRGSHFLYLVGRLKAGVTVQAAHADLDQVMAMWERQKAPRVHVPTRVGNFIHDIQFEPLKSDMVGGINTALWVLQGAVGFVLLIACANLANLILARSESRQREFAIRSALGAGRWRLLRQFMTEGVLLALAGGALGAAVGFAGLRALLASNPESIPRSLEIALDWKVLAFTATVSVITGLVFGMAPLLHLREQVVSLTLKEGGQRATAGSARARVRSGLVMAEVALAVILVIGAGLLLRSFQKLMAADPGFNRERLTTFGLVLPGTAYPKPESRVAFFNRLMDRLHEVPGVSGVATMTGLPPNRDVNANDTLLEGYNPTPDDPAANVDYYQTVSVDYLKTMGISVAKGRGFERPDIDGALVVLVNEALEKRFYTFRRMEAVGHRIGLFNGLDKDQKPTFAMFTIVGVVRDVKQGGMSKQAGTELYFLNDQGPRATGFAPGNMNIVVRSALPEDALALNIERAVREQDPSLPIVKLRTMDQVFADAASRPRFLAELLGIFAGLALALAAIGTYGILSYAVTQRTKEIGIHMALGATRGSVLGMVLGQGMRLTIAGLVAGLVASFGLTRLLQAQLFNVKPTDPATLTVVALFIALIAFVACYIPAQRATRVDPMVTLRES